MVIFICKVKVAVLGAAKSAHTILGFLAAIVVLASPLAFAQNAGLPTYANFMRWEGANQFWLRLDSGQELQFQSSVSCDDPHTCVFYEYQGAIASNQLYVVGERRYEGGDTLIISRKSGEVLRVPAKPEVSPDGRWLIVASDLEAYGPSGVWVYKIVQGVPSLQFAHQDIGYGLYRFEGWINPECALLIKTARVENEGMKDLAESPVTLALMKDQWRLQPAGEKELSGNNLPLHKYRKDCR